jgi:2,3,4,5-tetrahydropyridine-2-carboxylate N-succinyltransferase
MISKSTHRPPEKLKPLVEEAYALMTTQPAELLSKAQQMAIEETVGQINRGHIRVATPEDGGEWQVQAWVKQAILLFFKMHYAEDLEVGPLYWVDKIPIKKWNLDMGVRVVPPAVVRFGAFVASGCVLMPCYVNIGAYVDEGTMVDTWATVGSCAQIGKNVHLSGGVGIGGVLEPPQASPVIIEDDCFIGSRAIVVEGVRVRRRAVIGAGVVLTGSTPIVDVRGTEPVISKGVVPENSVVIPGTMPKKFAAGTYQVPCALVIGERSASTDSKTSLNQVLREFEVPV